MPKLISDRLLADLPVQNIDPGFVDDCLPEALPLNTLAASSSSCVLEATADRP